MSIMINETKNGIVSILNESGIPVYIGEMILKDILNDVSQISNQVREKEYHEYIKKLQKTNESKQKLNDKEKADE